MGLPVMILAAMLSGSALLAQGSRKDEIRIPSEALKPAYSKTYFEENLQNFKTWLEAASQLPPTGEEFKRRAREFDDISVGTVSLQLTNMRSIATNPDLEESTRLPRSWYAQMYNAALPMQSAAEILNSAKFFCEEKSYQKAKRIWVNAIGETLSVMENQPKKISKEEWERICAANRERRRKDYIKQYKAKQAEELRKAREKAAGRKTDRPKRTTEETEE